ncbi:MAG: hypothetical protein ACFFCS_28380 [Candidatus Hodarchaeota archaeon]
MDEKNRDGICCAVFFTVLGFFLGISLILFKMNDKSFMEDSDFLLLLIIGFFGFPGLGYLSWGVLLGNFPCMKEQSKVKGKLKNNG